MGRYARFDTTKFQLCELSERGHDFSCSQCRPLEARSGPKSAEFGELVQRISIAREHDRPVILMMGGDPIKLGLSRFLIDLLEQSIITHVASSGAGVIHDFELGLVGGTSENVAKWIEVGQFGLWRKIGRLNAIISEAVKRHEGLGEAVGRVIEEERFPQRDLSIAAACWRHGIPLTCHVIVGGDIIHAHPDYSVWQLANQVELTLEDVL